MTATVFSTTFTVCGWYCLSSAFLHVKKEVPVWKRLLLLLCVGLLYLWADLQILGYYSQATLLRSSLLMLRNIICAFLVMGLFQGSLLKKAFLAVFSHITMVLVDLLMFVFSRTQSALLAPFDGSSYHMDNITAPLSFVIFLLIRMIRYKNQVHAQPASIYLLQSIIPLICAGWVCYWVFSHPTQDLIPLGIACVLINVAAYALYSRLEKVHAENQRYALEQQRYALLEEYYKKVEAHQNEIRTIRHDLKNQLLAIGGHLEYGSESAGRQINALIQQLTAVEEESFTANPGINALLGAKRRQAKEQGILCDFTVKLPVKIAVEENDLAAVVGNVLDNAMEACAYCTGRRYIRFQLVYYNGALVLSSENSTDGKSQNLRTRKSDSQNHGLGMETIKRIVAKYGGDLAHQFTSNSFAIEITLFEKCDEKLP